MDSKIGFMLASGIHPTGLDVRSNCGCDRWVSCSPLAMAFGIASGVTPQAGIYTAVVAGFLISALGGSRLQIGGPTGAFVVIVAGIITAHGVSGLLMVTIMAGVILMLMAVTGLGTAVKYIPRPVTIGFTNGIAILIASTQIKDFLGLETAAVPSEFLLRMRLLANGLGNIQWPALLIGVSSLLIILLLPRLTKRVPGSSFALVLTTLAVAVFGLPVETIGSKFGGIPTGLPHVSLPQVRPDLIVPLLPAAVTVAMLAAIESLLSAVVADSMSGDRHNSNVELLAQGVANLIVLSWEEYLLPVRSRAPPPTLNQALALPFRGWSMR